MSPRNPRSQKKPFKINTETDLDHKHSGTRQERTSYLILCEGKTERDYFVGMRTRHGPHIHVDIPGSDHVSIAREAAHRNSDEYSSIWCVLDTELDSVTTTKVLAIIQQSSANACLSTPSFETWLIMHHKDCLRPFQSADEAKRKLKAIIPSWSEGSTRFSDFSHGVQEAVRRARKIDPSGESVLKNPSSNVWQLVDRLIDTLEDGSSKHETANPASRHKGSGVHR
ncbi:RloB family protein [Nonomuraea cavernae]|uniref:RloB family protein n=1 Tax=Nonomuraea cavernae TaxID=2045107 RepID=UPI0033C23684